MKSPYKLAQELSITPQAVYKKIKQLDEELTSYIKKENGKILLNDDAERILRNSFLEVEQPVQQPVDELLNNQSDEFNNQFAREIKFLQEQNLLLQSQNHSLQDELKIEREHSREITNRLIELTVNSQELTRNSQVLLKQEQDKNILMLSDERPPPNEPQQEDTKKTFFQRLFKNKK